MALSWKRAVKPGEWCEAPCGCLWPPHLPSPFFKKSPRKTPLVMMKKYISETDLANYGNLQETNESLCR